MKKFSLGSAVFVTLTLFGSLLFAQVDVLKTAKDLAESDFKGWTHGSKASEKQIDCVQFVLAVTEMALGKKLEEEARKKLLVSNLSNADSKQLDKLVSKGDSKIKGIQQALVDLENGDIVVPRNAKSGDFVQYWMKKKDGTWFGHAAVTESVEDKDGQTVAILFGAHQSSNGISSSKFKLKLDDDDSRQVFLVRLKTK